MNASDSELAIDLERCLSHGDAQLWESLVRRFHPIVASGVRSAVGGWNSSQAGLIEDAVQEAFARIFANNCRVLRNFHGGNDGALFNYLRSIGRSVTLDHFKNQSTQKNGSGEQAYSLDEVGSVLASPENVAATVERRLLLERVERCLESRQPRDRTIFWLYHRQGMKPKAIAALREFNLSQTGVETLVYRLTLEVGNCVRHGIAFRTAAEGRSF